jgi:hypothetical protein
MLLINILFFEKKFILTYDFLILKKISKMSEKLNIVLKLLSVLHIKASLTEENSRPSVDIIIGRKLNVFLSAMNPLVLKILLNNNFSNFIF